MSASRTVGLEHVSKSDASSQRTLAHECGTCSRADVTVTKSPHVLVEREGHVPTAVLNRPESRHALALAALARLADAWDLIDGDDQLRVAILTGAGGHFSSGADLKQMHNPPDDEWSAGFKQDPDLHWKAYLRSYRLRKPLIAAVEGSCIAGGAAILQGADTRIAGRSSKFAIAEARGGV